MGISAFTGLSSDELKVLPGLSGSTTLAVEHQFFRNELTSDNVNTPLASLYSIANAATFAIERLSEQPTQDVDPNSKLTVSVKKQLLGEAKFIRAFCYFYLVNLYGDVPLLLTINSLEIAKMPRTSQVQVYNQIVTDLIDAKDKLSKQFLSNTLGASSNDRIRPTYWAAAALLSRVYLYMGNNAVGAEANANEVISNSNLFDLISLDQTFLKNTKESIWQLQPVINGWNSCWGRAYILTKAPSTLTSDNPYKPFFLNESLVSSFEINDPRKSSWIGSFTQGADTYYFANKYKKGGLIESAVTSPTAMTEFMTVIRLSEQYLIRAEARIVLGNFSGGAADINAIRARARGGTVLCCPIFLLICQKNNYSMQSQKREDLNFFWNGEIDGLT